MNFIEVWPDIVDYYQLWSVIIIGYDELLQKIVIFCDYIATCNFYFYLDVLCKEQMLLQVQDIGGWITFPETIHELYAHLAELIGKGMEMFCNFNINIFNRVEWKQRLKKDFRGKLRGEII